MQTFNGKSVTINYRSDMSGEAYLAVKKKQVDFSGPGLVAVQIDPEDLLRFAAEFIRSTRIAELEQADLPALLGLPTWLPPFPM